MSNQKLSEIYKQVVQENFPETMEIIFRDASGKADTLLFKKVTWNVDGETKGLRYGENPDQPAALYRPVQANISIAGVAMLEPYGRLVTSAELIQFGKHPGKTNLTDVDSALAILRYLHNKPACAIIKHNNPSGVAQADTLIDAYQKAYYADRIAAFGGAVVVNRQIDFETAKLIAASYCEVVAAPEYEDRAIEVLQAKKNIRIMKITEMEQLYKYAPVRNLDFKTLLDGGCIVQVSFANVIQAKENLLPAVCEHKGVQYAVEREPDEREYEDMLFGWAVECGVTSNSILYVKDKTTLGIGTGEQDRVGVAEIARDKAYKKLADRLCWEQTGKSWNECEQEQIKNAVWESVVACKANLPGSVMVSDAFFPFRDGLDVGIREGITAVIQPGGALRDYEIIQACNEAHVAMKFTGQRCFRH